MSHHLLKAAAEGNVEKVSAYLDKGLPIDFLSKAGPGRTALIEAAIRGHTRVIQLLITKGASLDLPDRTLRFSPLCWACEEGQLETARTLIAAGADVNFAAGEYRFTPFILAAGRGSVPILQLLIAAGADVNAQTTHSENAISIAEQQHRSVAATFLRELGATPPDIGEPVVLPWPDVGQDLSRVDFTVPDSVVRGFILSMYRWEKNAWDYASTDQVAPTLLAEVRASEIEAFQPYCTVKKRPLGRCGSFGSPPEHDPSESLLSVNHLSKKRTEVVTRTNNLWNQEFLYVVMNCKGRYLIDSKKRRPVGLTEWENTIL